MCGGLRFVWQEAASTKVAPVVFCILDFFCIFYFVFCISCRCRMCWFVWQEATSTKVAPVAIIWLSLSLMCCGAKAGFHVFSSLEVFYKTKSICIRYLDMLKSEIYTLCILFCILYFVLIFGAEVLKGKVIPIIGKSIYSVVFVIITSAWKGVGWPESARNV